MDPNTVSFLTMVGVWVMVLLLVFIAARRL